MAIGVQVTFDCTDPGRLASFWMAALGYEAEPPPDGFDSWEAFATTQGIPPERWNDVSAARDPSGNGPRLFFQRVPEPKTVKNRVHLDLNAGAGKSGDARRAHVDAEVTRLTGLGANVIRAVDEGSDHWVVMGDPEGNEFCVQ